MVYEFSLVHSVAEYILHNIEILSTCYLFRKYTIEFVLYSVLERLKLFTIYNFLQTDSVIDYCAYRDCNQAMHYNQYQLLLFIHVFI